MASLIDVTKPTRSIAYTADVRANFAAAADEITALQLAAQGAPFLSVAGGVVSPGILSITGGGPGSGIVTGPPGYGISYYANAPLQGWAPAGGVAFAAVSRASDGNTSNAASIGIAAAGISDKTTGNANAGSWAYYGAAQRYPGALDYSTLVFEGDIGNKAPLVATNPYYAAPRGVTSCQWVGCGGELAQLHGPVNPASAAITIVSTDPARNPVAGSGGVFNRGIVFAKDAISGTDGVTGSGIAISLAKGHIIQWDYDLTGARGGGIRSQATATSGTLNFANGEVDIQDTSSHTIYRFDTTFNPDTGFFWTPASGLDNPAIFGTATSLTRSDMILAVTGTGNFSFNTGNGAQFQVLDNGASPTVNRAYAIGATTGNAPLFGARGNDTNIGLVIAAKGNGGISIQNDDGVQFQVLDSSGAPTVNRAYAVGAVAGSPPLFGARGTDTDIGLNITAKGAGIIQMLNALRVNGNVGFYNTAPVSKPTFSGAKGGNTALASVIAALVAIGLGTDTTTA